MTFGVIEFSYFTTCEFFILVLSLKQVSMTLLRFLANFYSAVVWMVSIFLWSLVCPVSFPGLWGPFQGLLQQLVSLSSSCSTILSASWQDPIICPSFCFLLFSLYGLLEQQNPLDDKFFCSVFVPVLDSKVTDCHASWTNILILFFY